MANELEVREGGIGCEGKDDVDLKMTIGVVTVGNDEISEGRG